MSLAENLQRIKRAIHSDKVTLVAVSKTQPIEKIQELFEAGQRDFGENRVQELIVKQPALSHEIKWHQVGHLQTNKVKYIAPFVHLIHSVDSLNLLMEINRQAQKHDRVIDCLLQIYIASEETKYGLDEQQAHSLLAGIESNEVANVRLRGVMGMATDTDDTHKVRWEFRELKRIYENIKANSLESNPWFDTISMGMSSDFRIAIEEGSTMIRVGSALFSEGD